MTCTACQSSLNVPEANQKFACVCGAILQVIWFRGRDAMTRFDCWRIRQGYMTQPIPAGVITVVELDPRQAWCDRVAGAHQTTQFLSSENL